MTNNFTEWLADNRSRIEAELVAEAESIARRITGKNCEIRTRPDFQSDDKKTSQGYFFDGSKQLKAGWNASVGSTGNPIMAVKNLRTWEVHTVTAWKLYQRQANGKPLPKRQPSKVIPQPTSTTKKCVNCGRDHDRQADNCYHCYIASLWPVALPAGDHPYLSRKEIPATIANEAGVRCYGDMLLIPFNGGNGWQVIYANGGKFFAVEAGTMAGSFCAIGNISNTIYVTEGFATGVSCHLALNAGVVVAFNAGNLANVVSQLRDDYPDKQIIILADNDIRPAGSDKQNTGLVVSTQVAIDHHCQVALPPATSKTDWNDYHLLHGLPATRQAINDNTYTPAPTIELPKEWQRLANERTKVFAIDQRFLSDDILAEVAERGAVGKVRLVVVSAMETGKTSNIIRRLCDDSDTVRLYGHRRALSRNQADATGTVSQLDIEGELIGVKVSRDKVAVVINSITNNRYSLPGDQLPGTVIVDEIEQVLSAIASGTVDNKEAVYTELTRQLNGAQVSAIMDADLSPATVERLADGFDGSTIVVVNLHKPYNERKFISYEAKGDAISELKRLVTTGPVAVAFGGSVEAGQAILTELKHDNPKLRTIYINEKTAKQHRDFTRNLASGSFTEFDVVMFSPVYQAGVDINDRQAKHFVAMFGIFDRLHTSQECWQMIGRVRSGCEVHCYVPNAGQYVRGMTRQSIIENKLSAYQAELNEHRRLLKYVDTSILAGVQPAITPAITMQVDSIFNRNENLKELRALVISQAEAMGCIVTHYEKTDSHKPTMDALKERRDAIKRDDNQRIATTHNDDPLSSYEADIMKVRNNLCEDDRQRLAGYEVAEFYDKQEIDATDIETYPADSKATKQLTALLAGEVAAINATIDQIDDSTNFIDLNYHAVAFGHKVAILNMLGITLDGDGLNFEEVEWDYDSLWNNKELIIYLRKNRQSLNGCGLMGGNITNYTFKRFKLNKGGDNVNGRGLTTYINSVVRACGLELQSQRGDDSRWYFIDGAEYERILDLARLDISNLRKFSIDKENKALCGGESQPEAEAQPVPQPVPQPEPEPATDNLRKFSIDKENKALCGGESQPEAEAQPVPQPVPQPEPEPATDNLRKFSIDKENKALCGGESQPEAEAQPVPQPVPQPEPEPATDNLRKFSIDKENKALCGGESQPEAANVYERLNDSQKREFTWLWQFFSYAEVERTFSQWLKRVQTEC